MDVCQAHPQASHLFRALNMFHKRAAYIQETFVSESDFSTHSICWLQILIDASNGASDYGNKFGEPLIQVHTFLYCVCSLWKVLN
jgi:phosphoribosylformylglycinamidine (FGAM) synthase-like enzyme